jgi:hypothetical protein
MPADSIFVFALLAVFFGFIAVVAIRSRRTSTDTVQTSSETTESSRT